MATWALLCQAMIDRAVGSRDLEVAGGMLDVVAKVSLVSEPEVDVTGADGRGTGTCGPDLAQDVDLGVWRPVIPVAASRSRA
jgi:hypothetical protein